MGWQTTFSQALNGDSTGWSGLNLRQVLAASLLSVNGSAVRLTLQASTSQGGCSIDNCYIGHAAGAGDPYDFDGTQVQVLFSGSASVSISQGTSVLSDGVNYTFDHTKNFIIAAHFNTTSSLRTFNPLTNASQYLKTAADETSVADVTSYSLASSRITLVNLIEVFVADAIVPYNPWPQAAPILAT